MNVQPTMEADDAIMANSRCDSAYFTIAAIPFRLRL